MAALSGVFFIQFVAMTRATDYANKKPATSAGFYCLGGGGSDLHRLRHFGSIIFNDFFDAFTNGNALETDHFCTSRFQCGFHRKIGVQYIGLAVQGNFVDDFRDFTADNFLKNFSRL